MLAQHLKGAIRHAKIFSHREVLSSSNILDEPLVADKVTDGIEIAIVNQHPHRVVRVEPATEDV